MAKHIAQPFIQGLFIRFPNFDRQRSNGTREFLRQIMCDKWRILNPKMVIKTDFHFFDEDPSVTLFLSNGECHHMVTANQNVREIFEDMSSHTKRLEFDMIKRGEALPEVPTQQDAGSKKKK
eukprot:c6132_g2_i1.p1 GENE.c6132_g2_i1~~c6132_g2_i1.p1  ORF type:complete len:138 (+),score=34.09 c6132_g2_i1:49-414(+)